MAAALAWPAEGAWMNPPAGGGGEVRAWKDVLDPTKSADVASGWRGGAQCSEASGGQRCDPCIETV